MIRGISFEISPIPRNVLWKILQAIDVSKFQWRIIQNQTEIWDATQNNDFFNQDVYDGSTFFDLIHKSHNIVFLKTQAYLLNANEDNISTYQEFLMSKCQVLFLIYDCIFAEVYAKSQANLVAIYDHLKQEGFPCVQYITDANDRRKSFDIC